ncbi:MAG TPA: EAL domain-containing response regulator [Gammaproteobacteria bacterium]|nr:EAL domain-containing response regulator [Gammaproteobacteria bacterium]
MADRNPVLIALDDDEQIVEVVTAVGKRAGFEVIGTTYAAAFQDARKRCDPDVIVLDLQMPDMDGIEMLRHLADQRAQAAIILVTGMDVRTIAAAEHYATSRGLRVLAAMQKPFMPEELQAQLEALRAAARPLTAGDLHQAIERNQLMVYYQPTVRRFADGTWDIATMEALLRWAHPARGILTPETFIGMGEEHGLSRAMTDFVIQRGIEQLKGWQARRLNVGLRINIAATLIADIGFPDRLESMLAAQDVDASALTLEITETAMLDQAPDTLDILTRLRVKDINLAIDDFGIGYSSLTQLFRMPFNEMKVDKSLTLRVPQSKEARIMIEALIDLAHKLNLTVCAEGVESAEALEFLGSIGCDSAQGFFISRPLSAQQIPDMIRSWEGGRKFGPSDAA